KKGATSLEDRKRFALGAFQTSAHYDTVIANYFAGESSASLLPKEGLQKKALRYGENPHQTAEFYGKLDEMLEQIHGKELSFNNLVDIDAAVALIQEFDGETAFAILKHTNACGVAIGTTVKEAYEKAFAADTVSAFGGILVTNAEVDQEAAEAMHDLFFEVLIAPAFTNEALEVLTKKKKRILLVQKQLLVQDRQFKTLLNGVIEQDRDQKTDAKSDLTTVTKKQPTEDEIEALLFASKVCKHTKSNTIILAKKGQMLSSGVGQTSRVDALKQAIDKAGRFGFDLNGAVIASDAFFPFPDCVEIAHKEGVTAVIQPGGSIRDQDSIDFCNQHQMTMITTGVRHFKH
ncbi:MAG: bifunctional phosphoribosylaminoimidazolecarboxamide formyltransferase/IMP cyclohydrolase, partial [Tunicatimonas sp.]|uniref:bifunctional phosphoribosylaminoimidazolecarboxamide formyltransferase/IMP cyclohydrolase n=1 Tax=Tunicatimonas sp. TaxID=1940096 RepID=UPI003C77C102